MAKLGRTYGRRAAGSEHTGRCGGGRHCSVCCSDYPSALAERNRKASAKDLDIKAFLDYRASMEVTNRRLFERKMGYHQP